MCVVAQLPPEMGGASGKVRRHFFVRLKLIAAPGSICRHRGRVKMGHSTPISYMLIPTPGTFRPDRIRSIADRFGVDGNMALENILYGDSLVEPSWARLKLTSTQHGHSIANIRYLISCLA